MFYKEGNILNMLDLKDTHSVIWGETLNVNINLVLFIRNLLQRIWLFYMKDFCALSDFTGLWELLRKR